MTNKDVAEIFNRLADLLEIKGEVVYKIVAYRRAADSIAHDGRDINQVWREGKLRTIAGVGEAIEKKIAEILGTGRLRLLDETAESVPDELITLLDVPGVGPRTARLLYEKLGITNVAALERAARDGQIRSLPGLGLKSEENILHGIDLLHRRSNRYPLGEALPVAEEVIAGLRSCPAVQRVDAAGSLRRRRPTVGDIDVLAAADDPQTVVDYFIKLPRVGEVVSHGDFRATVILDNGVQVDLMVLAPDHYGSLLQHFTGSKDHNVHLRQIALDRGLSFSERGFQKADGSLILCATEEDVYRTISLPWIPPELREDRGEFQAARLGKLPALVEQADLKGDLHAHSRWSDGVATIEEMARAAQALGYQYIAMTDHSRSLGIANGLSPERLHERREEIVAVNDRLAPFTVLSAVEVDIMADGTLGLPDEALAELDLVIASPHSSLRQDRETITARLVRAIRNPVVDIIGHPTGGLLGEREPADVDMSAVIAEAVQRGVALEINANPARLDLDDVYSRQAREAGVMLCINTDAHRPDIYGHMAFGIAMARRAWCEPPHILNTRSLDDLRKWLAQRRASRQ